MILILFESIHAVILAEKKCREAGIRCNIIPVPRSLSSQCGLCIEVDSREERRIAALLDEHGIAYSFHKEYVK